MNPIDRLGLASLGGAWTYEAEPEPMSENLKAVMSNAAADTIGTAVSSFLAGRVELGHQMFALLPREVGWTLHHMESFVRITPLATVKIQRPGLDVFLQHADVYPSGKTVVEVKRFGVIIEREVHQASRLVGASSFLSAPMDSPDPIFTWVIDAPADAWLEGIRKAAGSRGLTTEQVDAAVATVRAVRTEFPLVPSGGRRLRKPTRRQAIAAGMVAAGIPLRWRALWWVASYFIPAPIRALIDAVIWAVDTYIEVT
jgi:hypothetical protein